MSKPGENEANRRWGSLRRKKGGSPDTETGTLPRHLERGKNLSKRFRKSCRNWAASKGLIGQKPCSDVDNKEVPVETPGDILVIDLDEEPEIHYKRSSEDSDIGRLVADLVLDAKRRNTLPRSGSKQSVGNESADVPLTALEKSKAVNEETEEEKTAEVTSPGGLLDKSPDDSEAEIEELKDEKKGSGKILETSFDEHQPSEVSTDNDLDKESPATKASETTEDSIEIFESIGETLFYNGITLNKEFAVRASYSEELFKEETATSSETSQLDQAGFTEISTFNISTEECLDENIKENENNDDEKTELNEDLCLKDVVTEGESLGFIKTKDELVEKEWLFNGDMIGLEEGKVCSTNTDNMSLSEEEVNETCGENQVDDLHRNGCLSLESSEHDFNSIAKISALDFLNEDESDDEEDEDDEDNEDNDFYRRYFGSSLSFPRQHMFTKDCSFPSISVSLEDEETVGKAPSASAYLEAINPELDKADENTAAFRLSSAEFRINPFYKDEDSLSNSLVLNPDSQNQTFNYNFQQFFDLWEIFSQECKDDKPAGSVPENSRSPTVGLCNLEAIQEEDETDEDFERDENNNYDDDEEEEEYESDEHSEPVDENIDPAVKQQTSLFCLDGENVELIECEGEKNVTADNSEKSGTVAVMSGDNVENKPGTADTDDTDDRDDYKLYEGLSVLFQPEPYHHSNTAPSTEEENDFSLVNMKTNDLIDLAPEESVEDYIEDFLESLILNIVSLKELSGSDYLDIDDEYYSCDSPIEDENDRTDLHSEFGSDRGISTDEGIDATTDEDEEEEDEVNKVKEKFELERDSALVSTKF